MYDAHLFCSHLKKNRRLRECAYIFLSISAVVVEAPKNTTRNERVHMVQKGRQIGADYKRN